MQDWWLALARRKLIDDAGADRDRAPWVGQEVTLRVDLLAGILRQRRQLRPTRPQRRAVDAPADHPVVGNETIDGTLYSVQAHTLRAWPMCAVAQSIPVLSVCFSFKR